MHNPHHPADDQCIYHLSPFKGDKRITYLISKIWLKKTQGSTTTTTPPPSVIPLTRGLGRSECRQSYPCEYLPTKRPIPKTRKIFEKIILRGQLSKQEAQKVSMLLQGIPNRSPSFCKL